LATTSLCTFEPAILETGPHLKNSPALWYQIESSKAQISVNEPVAQVGHSCFCSSFRKAYLVAAAGWYTWVKVFPGEKEREKKWLRRGSSKKKRGGKQAGKQGYQSGRSN
jgi:hypothetical protein